MKQSSENNIQSLFKKYSPYTDKEFIHHYGAVYEQWLRAFNTVHDVLELGCSASGGGCLLGFSDRFPSADIIGVDITMEKVISHVHENKNIHLFKGDVYHWETVEHFKGNFSNSFDIIVDDCLHTPEDQIKAFELWHPLLSPHGLYVIEDVCELDRISMLLSEWNHSWKIFLGDTRTKGDEFRSDSILIGLQRVS